MKLPNLQNFKDRVMAMTREKIGNNFELVTPLWQRDKITVVPP